MAAQPLGIGWDDDEPDKHQFVHYCYDTGEREELTDAPGEYREVWKPLCGSDRLWFYDPTPITEEEPALVDCPYCLLLSRHKP